MSRETELHYKENDLGCENCLINAVNFDSYRTRHFIEVVKFEVYFA